MRCPDGARLAAAVSGEDAQAARHVAQCARCAADADDVHDLLALAHRAPVRTPSPARRAELAEELLARAELADDLEAVRGAREPRARDELADAPAWVAAARRKRRAVTAIAAVAAAAATVAAVVALGRGHQRVAAAPVAPVAPVASEHASSPDRAIAHVSPPPLVMPTAGAREPIITVDDGSDVQRNGREVALIDGAVAIDARDRAPAVVVVRGTRVAIADANARITARHGAIESVRVFSGSVEIATDDRRVAVSEGDEWTAPAATAAPTAPATAAAPTAPSATAAEPATGAEPATAPAATATATAPVIDRREASARAFRDGWTALRDGRNADAVAAFDRASDAAVAEDAAYWAAIATDRLGDRAGAARRLRDFLAHYPASPRVAAARSVLARIEPVAP